MFFVPAVSQWPELLWFCKSPMPKHVPEQTSKCYYWRNYQDGQLRCHWNNGQAQSTSHYHTTVRHTCCLCSSLERKAPDMKRLSRPLRSSLRREVRRGRRASREASVILLPGRAKLSNLGPKHRPTWRGREDKKRDSDTNGKTDRMGNHSMWRLTNRVD